MKKICSNCEFKNLCGCPVIEYYIDGKVESCSQWSISFKAYVKEQQKKEKLKKS